MKKIKGKYYIIWYNIHYEHKGEKNMFKLEFILPFLYGCYTSAAIIKNGLFTLDMNLLTWSVYFLNIFMAYVLYKVGKVIDRCLVHLF